MDGEQYDATSYGDITTSLSRVGSKMDITPAYTSTLESGVQVHTSTSRTTGATERSAQVKQAIGQGQQQDAFAQRSLSFQIAQQQQEPQQRLSGHSALGLGFAPRQRLSERSSNLSRA